MQIIAKMSNNSLVTKTFIRYLCKILDLILHRIFSFFFFANSEKNVFMTSF